MSNPTSYVGWLNLGNGEWTRTTAGPNAAAVLYEAWGRAEQAAADGHGFRATVQILPEGTNPRAESVEPPSGLLGQMAAARGPGFGFIQQVPAPQPVEQPKPAPKPLKPVARLTTRYDLGDPGCVLEVGFEDGSSIGVRTTAEAAVIVESMLRLTHWALYDEASNTVSFVVQMNAADR